MEASASLFSHRDESENGLKRGEKMEHNNNHVLLKAKAYLLLLFLQRKNALLLTDKYLSKTAFFLTGIPLDQKISFSVNLLTTAT